MNESNSHKLAQAIMSAEDKIELYALAKTASTCFKLAFERLEGKL